MQTLRTFETSLFPDELRWRYALANIANDAARSNSSAEFSARATPLYPGFDRTVGKPMMGIMNLMIPIGCNASCPSICYTDIVNWRSDTAHLSFKDLVTLIEEFRELGGRLIRIVGDGEPVLYAQLPELCRVARAAGIEVLVFSNGVVLPDAVRAAYAEGGLYFYLKLWSEAVAVQTRMVAPKRPYVYVEGSLGAAPASFYELFALDPTRVGFQVMLSTLNESDARQIIDGPKTEVPLFIEPFIPEGSGKNRLDFIVRDCAVTKTCDRPPRASYLGVVNSRGELQAGTFVPEYAVPVKGRLRQVWGEVFSANDLFSRARFTSGCFCEAMRSE